MNTIHITYAKEPNSEPEYTPQAGDLWAHPRGRVVMIAQGSFDVFRIVGLTDGIVGAAMDSAQVRKLLRFLGYTFLARGATISVTVYK